MRSYTSDVAFVLPVGALEKELDSLDLSGRYSTEGYRLYVLNFAKWQKDDVTVSAIEEYIRNRPNDCLLIRLGSSETDIEVIGGFWDNPFNLRYKNTLIYDA